MTTQNPVRVEADYLIETAIDPNQAAEIIAGEQSSGTFRPVPGESAELIWKFNNSVDIEVACNVPGHYEVGMIAKIDI